MRLVLLVLNLIVGKVRGTVWLSGACFSGRSLSSLSKRGSRRPIGFNGLEMTVRASVSSIWFSLSNRIA